MTKEELKIKLVEHNFKTYNEYLDFVEDVQRMSREDKHALIKEEYDAEQKEN